MNASCNWVDLLQVSSVQFTCCEQATGVLIRLGLGTGTGKADVRGGVNVLDLLRSVPAYHYIRSLVIRG